MKRLLITAALAAAAAWPSSAKTVRIPVSRGAGGVPVPCGEDPLRTCHNRWHPDIPEAAEANAGDTVIFETRDAFDNPFNRTSTPATVAAANLNLIHPLTGPLHVRGAKRGDVLAVTMIDVGPGSAKDRCLRTIPPRENGGNTDVKQMVKGTTLLFPCFIDGCGLSVGDVHWAQGDGEVSGTAIEMNAIVTVKIDVRKRQATALGNWPRFESNTPGVLKDLAPEHFVATMGIPVKPAGVVMAPELWIDVNSNHLLRPLRNESEDVTLASRDALLKMIALLTGPGSPSPHQLTAEQAYLLCSVACDLHISNLVDVPNYVVSNFLQLDVFDHGDDGG